MSAMLDVAGDVRARAYQGRFGYGFMWNGTQKWGGLRWVMSYSRYWARQVSAHFGCLSYISLARRVLMPEPELVPPR